MQVCQPEESLISMVNNQIFSSREKRVENKKQSTHFSTINHNQSDFSTSDKAYIYMIE